MSDNNWIDPEALPEFSLPESFLDELYEFTGSPNGNKGFVLIYTDQNGRPLVYCRSDSQIVEMGLRKSMEKYLVDLEHSDSTIDLMDGEDNEEV